MGRVFLALALGLRDASRKFKSCLAPRQVVGQFFALWGLEEDGVCACPARRPPLGGFVGEVLAPRSWQGGDVEGCLGIAVPGLTSEQLV